jgi:hypothetical protein
MSTNRAAAFRAHYENSNRIQWQEDIFAGLLINGVRRDEIAIEDAPGLVLVRVRGEVKYAWDLANDRPSTRGPATHVRFRG